MVFHHFCSLLEQYFLVSTLAFGIRAVRSAKSKVSAFGLKNIGELATQAGYFTSVQVLKDVKQLWGMDIPLT